GIAARVRRVPPGALIRSVLPIARSELDFKLVELVPLSVGTLPFWYREQLLKALARGNRLGPVHGGIIPSLRKMPREACRAPLGSRNEPLYCQDTGKVAEAGQEMKLPMAKDSLFAILLRSPWWIS